MPERGGRRRQAILRAWLRALHRDAGYSAIGLTFVYALSGLAVNHIKDWNPNFHQVERMYQLPAPLPSNDDALSEEVRGALRLAESPREVYRASEKQIDIVFDRRTLHVNPQDGRVIEEGEEPRFFLRVANWLHLNRGKKAWTVVADGYAVFLLFLASSGLFMIPGRKGFLGRGALFVGIGAALPALYVVLSGGP